MSVLRADAPFFWPLRGNLALQAGSGSPTFTRATAAWEFNETGKLYKVPSGAVRMRGYRPVINWFTDPDNISGSASWATSNVSKASAIGPDGGSSDGCLLTCTLNDSNYIRQSYNSATVGGNTRTERFLYKPGTAGWMRILFYAGSTDRVSLWFNATTNVLGTVSTGGSGWASISYALTASNQYPGWYEIYMAATTPATGTHYMQLGFVDGDNSINATSVSGLTLTIAHPMLEDSTGRTDKTPSEYVYGDNGAGATGVKYYATYKDGTPIPEANLLGARLNPNAITNNLRYCRDLTNAVWSGGTTGSELVVNGTPGVDTSGWYTDDSVLSIAGGALEITTIINYGRALQTLSLTVGKRYIVSFTFTKTGGNAEVGIAHASDGSGGVYDGKINVSASGTYSFGFVAGSSTRYLNLQVNTLTPGDTARFSLISVKEAAVQASLTGTGIDGQANACTLLTATTNDATISQTITAAAAAACSGFYVKRSAGTGSIFFTRDGGANWTDITNLINSSTFTLVKIENTSVTNPQIMFKIATSGDAIIVDAGINHLGAQISETPIITTSASVTVNADVLTAPTSGNFSDAAGTILATVTRDDWTAGNGSAVGSSTRGLYTSSANSGAQGVDGTNTINGPSGTPSGTMKIGIRWSGSSMQVFANGVFQSAGSYDGSFNLASIAAADGVQCTIKDVAIWQTSLSDEDMISASKGMTIDGAAASLTLTAPDGHLLAGRTIAAAAVSLALTAPSSQIIIGRYIESSPATLSLAAPDGERIIGRYIQANAATITLTAPDGRVLLDDSPRSAVTIAATLASPTITARL